MRPIETDQQHDRAAWPRPHSDRRLATNPAHFDRSRHRRPPARRSDPVGDRRHPITPERWARRGLGERASEVWARLVEQELYS